MLSTAITVRNLTKTFSKPGTETQFIVLDDISLGAEEGKFVSSSARRAAGNQRC